MDQCIPLGWIHYGEESVRTRDDLTRLLAQTTAELEATVLAARDEIMRKEEELLHMRDLLAATFKERDEAHHQFQKLLVEKLSLQQRVTSFPRALVVKGGEGNVITNVASFSSDESEESVISEQFNSHLTTPSSPTLSSSLPPMLVATLGKQRPLPEKGKLLQAVIEAGPTLQTLMVAGPLPEWRQPPPQLDRIEIPPVTIPSSSSSSPVQRMLSHQDSIASNNGCMVSPNTNNKRALDSLHGPLSSPSFSKYQRVVQTS